MRTETTVKNLLAGLYEVQKKHTSLLCPRCGKNYTEKDPAKNSLSRYANVYICNQCGTEEAILDAVTKNPLPLTEWHAAKMFLKE